ncbi:hypothetical protein NDU88_005141 [Pleurodeles waltl]|uniref:Putative nuclease HARBI1 n=2 Tax=Pleurodeles waltl TaxID=8319 RepID=A0AAV7QHZ7_PLEWA|nr:hypothetical protein NDU88_005141 [Pleurodeles waltl]
MAVTSVAVRIITTGALHHWLLGPIGSNVNQCSIATRSTTAYCNGVQRQCRYLTSHCPSLEVRQPPFQGPTWLHLLLRHTYLGLHSTYIQEEFCVVYLWVHTWKFVDSVVAVVLPRHRQLGHLRRWQNPPVYRPLVDLLAMEEQHLIITYRFDRATTQLVSDLMSPIRHPTGIPPDVQVLSVHHFLASGSFQTTVAVASGMSQPMFSNVLSRVLSALLKHVRSYIVFPQVEDLATVKGDFYALGHIPNIIGAIDGTHVALVPPHRSEQVYRNRKSYHSMNLQMVCLADQYISQVNAMLPGSVHDAYILRNSSIPYVMGQLQRHRVWLLGDSGYPNLSWLLTPVRNPRTRAEERYNEAHGRTRRVIERTFGLLKARFRCLHMTGGSLFYSPKKVCQIIIACSMLHNLALRRQVPFLQEDGPDGGVVAAVEPVEPVDSDEEEAEEEDIDNRESVIRQYFQ